MSSQRSSAVEEKQASPIEEKQASPPSSPPHLVWRVAAADFEPPRNGRGACIRMQLDQRSGKNERPLAFARSVVFDVSGQAARQLQRLLVHPDELPLVDRRGVGFHHRPGGAVEILVPVTQWDGADFVRTGTERHRLDVDASRRKLNAALADAVAALDPHRG